MRSRHDDKFQEALHSLQVGNGSRSWLDRVMKKRIVLHTRDSLSIEGVLMEVADDGVILRAAKLLNADGPATVMAGETWVPQGNVAFAQLDE